MQDAPRVVHNEHEGASGASGGADGEGFPALEALQVAMRSHGVFQRGGVCPNPQRFTRIVDKPYNGVLVLVYEDIISLITADEGEQNKRLPGTSKLKEKGMAWLLASLLGGRVLSAPDATKAGGRFLKQAKATAAAILSIQQRQARIRKAATDAARGNEVARAELPGLLTRSERIERERIAELQSAVSCRFPEIDEAATSSTELVLQVEAPHAVASAVAQVEAAPATVQPLEPLRIPGDVRRAVGSRVCDVMRGLHADGEVHAADDWVQIAREGVFRLQMECTDLRHERDGFKDELDEAREEARVSAARQRQAEEKEDLAHVAAAEAWQLFDEREEALRDLQRMVGQAGAQHVLFLTIHAYTKYLLLKKEMLGRAWDLFAVCQGCYQAARARMTFVDSAEESD